jgi:hypothetical protein
VLLNKDLLLNPKMKRMKKNMSAISCRSTSYGMNLPGKLRAGQEFPYHLRNYQVHKIALAVFILKTITAVDILPSSFLNINCSTVIINRDSSVGIAKARGLTFLVRIPAVQGFYLLRWVQYASYSVCA